MSGELPHQAILIWLGSIFVLLLQPCGLENKRQWWHERSFSYKTLKWLLIKMMRDLAWLKFDHRVRVKVLNIAQMKSFRWAIKDNERFTYRWKIWNKLESNLQCCTINIKHAIFQYLHILLQISCCKHPARGGNVPTHKPVVLQAILDRVGLRLH